MAVTTVKIPTSPDNPYPLGRHVEHDDRSRRFGIEPVKAEQWSTCVWPRYVPILNQSDLISQGIQLAGNPDGLSSCCGNAGIGAIGSAPLWMKQLPSLRRALKDPKTAEIHAIDLYASATEEDEFDGAYPPTDDGTSGLGTCKAMVKLGYIRSYLHAFGLNDLISALQHGPVMMGVNWYEAMFNPAPNGSVEIAGAVAGGHEFVVDAVFVEERLLRCPNSWTPQWGDGGCFFLSYDQADRLLGEQGDITVPQV